MVSSKALRALLLLGVLGVGCDPYTRSTVIMTKSALDVAVQDSDSDSRLPASAEPAAAEVARTEVLLGPGSTSDLIVIATRRPGGSIVTEWQTRLPLVNGERHVLMDAAGTTTLAGTVPIDTKESQITIPVCGILQQQSRKGTLLGYGVVPSTPCDGPYMTRINLETPRENLLAIHHVATNDVRAIAILGAVMSTIALGGFGTLLTFGHFADRQGALQPPGAGQRIAGIALLTVGASLDLALLPMIFAPDKDDVVYPASK